jgi:hypothetical protein
MRRSQRTVHAYVWPALALIMAATVILALIAREHPAPGEAAHATQETR